LLADMLHTAGASRALIMDMHSPQVQGFFSMPCDHLLAAPEIVRYLKKNWNLKNYCLVAGDAGAAKMLKLFADGLNLPVAIMDKRREGNEENVIIKGVIGDVKNKKALIIDDETQTGGTLTKDAKYLIKKAGAISVDACFVHAALGLEAEEKLNKSPIKKFVTTDTIPLEGHNLKNCAVVSVTKKFAECIGRIHEGKSIKSLNDL
ncbi:MAG: ribose-phosphate diphosphokinase, partial [Patescibacteria group bacterium]